MTIEPDIDIDETAITEACRTVYEVGWHEHHSDQACRGFARPSDGHSGPRIDGRARLRPPASHRLSTARRDIPPADSGGT